MALYYSPESYHSQSTASETDSELELNRSINLDNEYKRVKRKLLRINYSSSDDFHTAALSSRQMKDTNESFSDNSFQRTKRNQNTTFRRNDDDEMKQDVADRCLQWEKTRILRVEEQRRRKELDELKKKEDVWKAKSYPKTTKRPKRAISASLIRFSETNTKCTENDCPTPKNLTVLSQVRCFSRSMQIPIREPKTLQPPKSVIFEQNNSICE